MFWELSYERNFGGGRGVSVFSMLTLTLSHQHCLHRHISCLFCHLCASPEHPFVKDLGFSSSHSVKVVTTRKRSQNWNLSPLSILFVFWLYILSFLYCHFIWVLKRKMYICSLVSSYIYTAFGLKFYPLWFEQPCFFKSKTFTFFLS